jgi:hypothetical protein
MSIGGYLIVRWLLVPLALLLLPILWNAVVAVASLFSSRPAVRLRARVAVLRVLIMVGVFFGAVFAATALEQSYPGRGDVVLFIVAAILMAWSVFAGRRDSQRIQEEVDQVLANMRGEQAAPRDVRPQSRSPTSSVP